MKHVGIVLMAIIFQSCVAQKQKLEKENISFVVYKQSNLDSLAKKVAVYFVTGFKDTICVKYDKETILNEFLETDFSTSYTGESIVINYENKPKGGTFTVESVNNKSKVKIKILRGYRVIELSRVNNYWEVIYSNFGPVFE